MARSIVVVADSIFPDLLFWLAAKAKALTAGDKGAKVSKGSKGGGGGGGAGRRWCHNLLFWRRDHWLLGWVRCCRLLLWW